METVAMSNVGRGGSWITGSDANMETVKRQGWYPLQELNQPMYQELTSQEMPTASWSTGT